MTTIGVLGGMGPEATNAFCALITALTPAQKDQDHIPVLCFNNPKMSDRTAAILGQGPCPFAEILYTGKMLVRAGASFLVMPCNTAHHYYDRLCAELPIPMLHMINETALAARHMLPQATRVGLMCTSGTLAAKIFVKPFHEQGFELVTPTETEQTELVMHAIYSIKAGRKEEARPILQKQAELLGSRGAQLIIAGCTEVPLALSANQLNLPLINPAEALARAAIRRAME